MIKKITLLLFACFLLLSCEKDIVNQDTSHISNFETFWETMDKNYVFFNEKRVNWNDIYTTYAPKFEQAITDEQALALFQEIVTILNDRHVSIGQNDKLAIYPIEHQTRIQFWRTYLNHKFENIVLLEHFHLAQLSNNVMYIRMLPMPEPPKDIIHIKNLIGQYDTSNGIIFDLRDCTGGRFEGFEICDIFFTGEHTVLYNQFRNGANHNSFTKPYPVTIKGTGLVSSSTQLIVLTNINTYSLGNSIVSILKDLTNCIQVGEKSGGGAGGTIPVLLGSGWFFNYTICKTLKLSLELTEDGIDPDIAIEVPTDYWDTTHSETDYDPQLDKALEILSNK